MSDIAEKPPTFQETMSNWRSGLGELDTPSSDEPTPEPIAEPAAPAVPAKPPAPVKPTDKPAPEPAPAETGKDDESKWPRSAKDWDAFKTKRKEKEEILTKERAEIAKERDTIKGELESTRKEIEKLKGQGPSPELDTLKKERDDYAQRLRMLKVEKDPKFEAHFNGRTNAQLDMAKRIVGTESAERITQILKLPDSTQRDQQLEEAMVGLSTIQQNRLGSVVNSLAQIEQERESEISRWRENGEALEKQEKVELEKRQTEYKQSWEKGFTSMVTQASDPKDGLYIFQKREGNDPETTAWNTSVDERIDRAKALVFNQDNKPETLAKAALYASGFPEILKWGKLMGEENTKLKEQIKALSAANPGLTQGENKPSGDPDNKRIEHKPGTNPFEASKAWMTGIMGDLKR